MLSAAREHQIEQDVIPKVMELPRPARRKAITRQRVIESF